MARYYDWSQVFQGSQLILKDFHAELLHGSHIFQVNFLTYYGLNNYSTDEMNCRFAPKTARINTSISPPLADY